MPTYEIYRICGLATLGIGVFAIIYIISSAPSRIASRLGLRGLKRTRAIAGSGSSSLAISMLMG